MTALNLMTLPLPNSTRGSTELRSLVAGSAENIDPDVVTYEGAKKLWGGELCALIHVSASIVTVPSPSVALSPSIVDLRQARNNFVISTKCNMNLLD